MLLVNGRSFMNARRFICSVIWGSIAAAFLLGPFKGTSLRYFCATPRSVLPKATAISFIGRACLRIARSWYTSSGDQLAAGDLGAVVIWFPKWVAFMQDGRGNWIPFPFVMSFKGLWQYFGNSMKSSKLCGWGEWSGLYSWGGKYKQIQGQNDSQKGAR